MEEQDARLSGAACDFPIEVRPIRYDEFDKYISCWRTNGFICAHEFYVLKTFRTNIQELIAAFRRDQIIGTAWDVSLVNGRRCIGALTVDPRYPDVLNEMIDFVRQRHHRHMPFDVNIPASLSPIFTDLGWTSHWDIRLYMGIVSRLQLLPLRNFHDYHIEQIISRTPLFLDSTPENSLEEGSEAPNLTPALNVDFNIYKDGVSVGCSNLKKIGTNPFVIGPVIACNYDAAIYLVRNMITYITSNNIGGYVATYVLKNHEYYCRFLIDSGFQLSDHEWTRCSLNETVFVNEYATYDNMRNTMYSLDCIMLCGL